MARKLDPRQMAFDFEAEMAVTPSPPAAVDMVQLLIDAGLIHGSYDYRCNAGTLQDHSVPYIPRSIAFPCAVVEDGGAWRLLLKTPANGGLPFVQRVASITGLTPEWVPENRGYGQWHHAVDLATDAGIDRLLGTLEYTTIDAAATGIGFGVQSGSLSIANARRALAVLGIIEPADRSAAFLAGDGMAPSAACGAPNIYDREKAGRAAWAHVHAIEDGWVTKPVVNRDGHVSRYSVVTAEGWRRRGVEHSGRYAKAA